MTVNAIEQLRISTFPFAGVLKLTPQGDKVEALAAALADLSPKDRDDVLAKIAADGTLTAVEKGELSRLVDGMNSADALRGKAENAEMKTIRELIAKRKTVRSTQVIQKIDREIDAARARIGSLYGNPVDPAAPLPKVEGGGLKGDKTTRPIGNVEAHKGQNPAFFERVTTINPPRISESEHVWARSLIVELTRDPHTGISPFDKGAYQASDTVKTSNTTARLKTNGDMEALRNLQRMSRTSDPQVLRDASLQAGIDREIAAARLTGDTSVTPGRITRAAHGQFGTLNAETNTVLKGGLITNPLRNATTTEIDAVVARIGTKQASIATEPASIIKGRIISKVPQPNVPRAGGTVSSIAAGIVIGEVHTRSVAIEISEQADKRGYVPYGEEQLGGDGVKGFLYRAGSFLVDSMGLAALSVGTEDRFNCKVWREQIWSFTDKAKAGDSYTMTWDHQTGTTDVMNLKIPIIEKSRVVYEKQADGSWRQIEGEYKAPVDFNFIIDRNNSDETVKNRLLYPDMV